MPTSYTDQFFFIDPFSPPPVGTAINFSSLSMTDQNDDGDLDRFNNDSVNGSDITSSYPGDTVTINVSGVGNVTYTGVTFYLADGTQVFTPTDGQVLQNGTLVSTTWVNSQGPLDVDDLGPPCFTAGTLIDTDSGPRPVEMLASGDRVPTRDNGVCTIRWIGRCEVSGRGDFAPIHFTAGAIGNEVPLLVSPNHRILVAGWRAELYAGEDEVLVAAKHMVNGTTIRVAPCDRITYVHLLFDRHEIVQSHGAWSESFYPGALIGNTDRETFREVSALFPGLPPPESRHCRLARPMVRRFEARVLAA